MDNTKKRIISRETKGCENCKEGSACLVMSKATKMVKDPVGFSNQFKI